MTGNEAFYYILARNEQWKEDAGLVGPTDGRRTTAGGHERLCCCH